MAKTKFGALAEFRQQHIEPEQSTTETVSAETPLPEMSRQVKGRGRPTGKRSNPDYEPTTVLLRKQTKKMAGRMLEDAETDQDLSELIEQLLSKWISRHS
ncbi:MAG: hypothetical protein M3Y72_14775 [Acidobacteriota bacterium]|nr:hypothetical protein [Acidobacteriota bacterium]